MRHHGLFLRPVPFKYWVALVGGAIYLTVFWLSAEAGDSLPSAAPDFPSIVRAYADRLAKLESDKDASNLFAGGIGPALHLNDAAKALRAKALPPKLVKELLLADLTAATNRLTASLAAWHLASGIRQSLKDQPITVTHERLVAATKSLAWLDQQETVSWHDALHQLSGLGASPEWENANQSSPGSPFVVALIDQATTLEVAALQTSYQEWDRIRNWKDLVRGLRGQTRLCGTWQWIIHNHQQHHQEQKLSLLFPPVGVTQAAIPGLVETIVLGENVYLRWEIDGLVQEDSLQFSKEGQRLEGTFVNSQGGWGSISGKRSAGCTP